MKYLLSFLILILIFDGCISLNNRGIDINKSNNEVAVFGYEELLNKINSRLQKVSYEVVTYERDFGRVITYRTRSIFSDFEDNGFILFDEQHQENNDIELNYRILGKVFTGEIELLSFPSFEEMLHNKSTFLFPLENSLIFDSINLSNIMIYPSDTYVFTPGKMINARQKFAFFDDFDQIYNSLTNSYIALYCLSDLNFTGDQGIEDRIHFMFFDRDTIIKGTDTIPPREVLDSFQTIIYGKSVIYEINAKKGWNIIWIHSFSDSEHNMDYETYKTDFSEIPNLNWVLEYW